MRLVLVSGVLVSGVLVSGVVLCSCDLPSVFIHGKMAHCATRCVFRSRDLTPFGNDARGFAFGVPSTNHGVYESLDVRVCGCLSRTVRS